MVVGRLAVGINGVFHRLQKCRRLAFAVADVQPIVQIPAVANFAQAAGVSGDRHGSQQRRFVIHQTARLKPRGDEGEIAARQNQPGQWQVESIVEIHPVGMPVRQRKKHRFGGSAFGVAFRRGSQNDKFGVGIIRQHPLDDVCHQPQILLRHQPPHSGHQNRVLLWLAAKRLQMEQAFQFGFGVQMVAIKIMVAVEHRVLHHRIVKQRATIFLAFLHLLQHRRFQLRQIFGAIARAQPVGDARHRQFLELNQALIRHKHIADGCAPFLRPRRRPQRLAAHPQFGGIAPRARQIAADGGDFPARFVGFQHHRFHNV